MAEPFASEIIESLEEGLALLETFSSPFGITVTKSVIDLIAASDQYVLTEYNWPTQTDKNGKPLEVFRWEF